jgi:putative flippase GtrA
LTKLSPKFKRYLIIGFGVYAFELTVIAIAQALGASSVLAVGLSFWLGLFLSFGLQKFVTFEDKRTTRRIIIPQFGAYAVLVLFNFAFTLVVAYLLQGHFPAWVSRSLALGLTTFWNFYLYKTRIFRDGQGIIN